MGHTIAIADDHLVIAQGLELALEKYLPEVMVKLVAVNGDDLLAGLERNPTDLVVLDLNMPGWDGFRLLREIKQRWPETMVIIFSVANTVASMKKALQNGADSYIGKTEANGVQAIIDAIRSAFRGEATFRGLQQDNPAHVNLGPKEKSLLLAWSQGATEISKICNILSRIEGTRLTRDAIQKRRQRIAKKLGLKGGTPEADLVARARGLGLI
jgi:DNA-binding NarL/FixJ family response regulator